MYRQVKAVLHRLITPRLLRYVIVGVAGYLLEMGIILGCGALEWPNELAVTLSYWIGLAASFALQKLYAFANKEGGKEAARQGAFYLVLVGVNYLFTVAAVYLVGDRVPVWVVRTVCLAVTTAWNYLIYSVWVFRDRRETHVVAAGEYASERDGRGEA